MINAVLYYKCKLIIFLEDISKPYSSYYQSPFSKIVIELTPSSKDLVIDFAQLLHNKPVNISISLIDRESNETIETSECTCGANRSISSEFQFDQVKAKIVEYIEQVYYEELEKDGE